MKKLIILLLSILFFVNKEHIIVSGITAINIWTNTLFPLLFPTFILNDLIMSTDIVNYIVRIFGPLYRKVFKIKEVGAYVFIMSMISGTPSNAKNLKELYENNVINEDDITKILCTCYFFNPLFIVSYTNIKTLIMLYIANIISSIIMNLKIVKAHRTNTSIKKNFILNKSIETNINILLNILGTITVFLCLSSIIPINNIYIKTLISGILELTTGLNLITSINSNLLIYKLILSIILSFGGLSIIYQIKSIFKDTSINYKYFFTNRALCSIILFILSL